MASKLLNGTIKPKIVPKSYHYLLKSKSIINIFVLQYFFCLVMTRKQQKSQNLANIFAWRIASLTGPAEPGGQGGICPPPTPPIFRPNEKQNKNLPSKDIVLLIALPDFQTFRRIWLSYKFYQPKVCSNETKVYLKFHLNFMWYFLISCFFRIEILDNDKFMKRLCY